MIKKLITVRKLSSRISPFLKAITPPPETRKLLNFPILKIFEKYDYKTFLFLTLNSIICLLCRRCQADRSSGSQMFFKIGVLKNFANFTGFNNAKFFRTVFL